MTVSPTHRDRDLQPEAPDPEGLPRSLDPEVLFPFPLDDFQQRAIAALNQGQSVVVCAPTGSGKTLVGEYAIYRALSRGKRVFYTTPLKALSNQKLRDFREQFGPDRVGLLTGDTSIERDAPVVVMTTEIFRNMLYGTPIGQVGVSLQDVEVVVLDECHYMNDRSRGTVWEESVIYCPQSVQIVALSATVANSDQLTDWLNRVHGPTQLVDSDFRPVPLEFLFGNNRGLFPLLGESGDLHPQFKSQRKKRRKPPQQVRQDLRAETPEIPQVLSLLKQRDMLPAIYFIFSRRGCDRAARAILDSGLSLIDRDEAARLRNHIDRFLAENPDIWSESMLAALERGIASHHAGVLPLWKHLVEELFQMGLIKVVFATETLAAGINMPARTTVISSLSKRTDRGHRLLNPSEFLQMAGRAGRRGMDDRGYVVTLQTPFEGAKEAGHLATSQADPLVSQFTPTYGMVLNLLQTHSLDEARSLVERSFGQYLSTLHLVPQQEEIAALEADRERLAAQLDGVDVEAIAAYEKLRQRLKEERRLLKILQDQAEVVQGKHLGAALQFAVAGTLLRLKGKHVPVAQPLRAVLVAKVAGSGQFPNLVCLGEDNRWYVAATADAVALHGEIPRMAQVDALAPPPDLTLKPGQSRSGDDTTRAIAAQMPRLPDLEEAPEVVEQRARLAEVNDLVDAHPVHRWHNRKNLFKRQKRLDALQAEIEERQRDLGFYTQRYWQEFSTLIEILQQFGCLADTRPTPLGETVAAIRGENELWLGLALTSGLLDDLPPHQLAAACAGLILEDPRPDTWTDCLPSNPVMEALGELRGLRRQLVKVQHRHRVLLPVWLQDELTGIVEQWALGADWRELGDRTSLDDGNIVRVLRRTLDLLSQIPHMPYLPEELVRNANRAHMLVDRFPVAETVG